MIDRFANLSAKGARLIRQRLESGVGTLSMAALVGQVLPILAMPLVTRLYTREAWGIQGLFVAFGAVLAPLATLRLELAILQAPSEHVPCLVRLSFLNSVSAGVLIAVVGLLAGMLWQPVALEGLVATGTFGALLGAGLILSGLFVTTSNIFLRLQQYSPIARARVFQSVASVTVTLGAGFAAAGPIGLMFAAIAAQGGGLLWHSFYSARNSLPHLRSHPSRTMEVLRTYYRYPLFICPAAVLNAIGLAISAPAIAAVFGAAAAGEYSLANRVTLLPVTLLGASVSQVFMSRLAQSVREKTPGQSTNLFAHYRRQLLPLGLLVLLVGAVSPMLFPILFGEKWEMSGWYASLMSIPAALQIVVSPLSSVVYFSDRQRLQLLLDAARFLLVLFAFLAVTATMRHAHAAVAAIASAHSLAYLAYGLAYHKIAGNLRDVEVAVPVPS